MHLGNKVADTISCGDSFLATFLSNFPQEQLIAKCLKKACLAGAFVATRKEATSMYALPKSIREFKYFHLIIYFNPKFFNPNIFNPKL